VFGVVPEDLRKIWVLRDQVRKELKTFLEEKIAGLTVVEIIKKTTKEKRDELLDEKMLLDSKLGLLDNCFWDSIRCEFPGEGLCDLGVRAGWNIVKLPPQESVIIGGFGILSPMF